MVTNTKINVDLRIVTVLLLIVVIVLSVLLWSPWSSSTSANTRTVKVTGEASMEAEPDEYQFSPSYQIKGEDRAAIQQQLTAKVNEVIAKLKEMGVEESDITLSSYTYDNFWNEDGKEVTSNTLTIKVDDNELSQKVQDYLLTTAPEGQISPYASFSDDKRKQFEEELRTLALAEAKKKADSMASELEVKVGKVVAIQDQTNGIVYPMMARETVTMGAAPATDASMPVMPGKQELSYTVEVTYEIK